MLSQRVDYLLDLLGTDNSRLSAYAGCSESNFSRMKSGARKLTAHSNTVKRFADAVCSCAADNGMTDQLCELTGCRSKDRAEMTGCIIDWLFSSEDISSLPVSARRDPAAFGAKLDSVMTLAEIANSRMARHSNVDASYISRLRNGKRMPKNNPELIDRLCSVIAVRCVELGRAEQLCSMIGAECGRKEPEALAVLLSEWLTCRNASAGIGAVSRLMTSISLAEHIPDELLIDLCKAADPEILNEKKEHYYGLKGLQRASVRLLGNAVMRGSETLLLYSDMNQRWLGQDFFPVWLTLMSECLKRGTKMHIIHHIDRAADEMIEALHKWLPLYMSGLIESYYCILPQGSRFSTTLFSDPGNACITGQCVTGSEDEAVFRYTTSPEEIAALENEICTLLSQSRPLLTVSPGLAVPEGEHRVYQTKGIRIYISSDRADVCKLTEPQMTFTLDHPRLVETLRAYGEMQSRGR